MTRNLRRVLYLFGCLLLLALVGCGAGTGSVSGKVTLKGKALTGGTVTFVGADKQVTTSPIDGDGSYTINKVAAGPAKISVTPPAVLPLVPRGMKMDPAKMGGGAEKPADPGVTAKPVSIPKLYHDSEKSGLTYTVTKGKNEHDIDLK